MAKPPSRFRPRKSKHKKAVFTITVLYRGSCRSNFWQRDGDRRTQRHTKNHHTTRYQYSHVPVSFPGKLRESDRVRFRCMPENDSECPPPAYSQLEGGFFLTCRT